MEIIRIPGGKAPAGTVTAIGLFDGVHVGHRALLRKTVALAKEKGLVPAVFTFTDLAGKGTPCLMTQEDRLAAFAECGIETVFLGDFSVLRDLDAGAFVRDVLSGDCLARVAVCGYDFRFGKDAAADAATLCSLLPGSTVLPPVTRGGAPVSSSRVRQALTEGRPGEARRLLGKPYEASGTVTHGKALGRSEGVPTANVTPEVMLPKWGVYLTETVVDGIAYPSLSDVGVRPTLEQAETARIETHLVGFSGDLYGKNVTVRFLRYIRKERKFPSEAALFRRIRRDMEYIGKQEKKKEMATQETTEWIKLTLKGEQKDIELLCAIMSMVDPGLLIEDYSDVTTDGMYGALIDDAILRADKTRASVSVFLPASRSLPEVKAYLNERLDAAGLSAEITTEGMKEEDWAEVWKKYYHPIPLGRVTVVPAWEEYTPKAGEAVIRMDPGMAFGTGTHETTRLVMEMMQEELTGGERVLDVGTGSGILALCASKLGAKECFACDVDPVAVRVAEENVKKDGATNIRLGVSDLLRDVDMTGGKYDFVVANIVSDIILRLLPDLSRVMTAGGKVILSGIIGERVEEIRAALGKYHFRLASEKCERDWYALCAVNEND